MSELFKRSVPKGDFAELSKLIHGFIKTGKTTLACQMVVGDKEPLFIATEDGHHGLNVLVESVRNWSDFKLAVKKLTDNKAALREQCSCIVLDLVSDLDQWCADYVCGLLHIKSLSDLEWGKGFSEHRKEFQREIAKLFDLLPLTFISHSKEKEISFEGEKIKTQAPNLSSGCLEYINGKVDLVGFIVPSSKTKSNPLVTFRPTRLAIAGSRLPYLAKDFELNPKNMRESYLNIVTAFQNK